MRFLVCAAVSCSMLVPSRPGWALRARGRMGQPSSKRRIRVAIRSLLTVVALAALAGPSAAQPTPVPIAEACTGGGAVPAACFASGFVWPADAQSTTGPVSLPDDGVVVAGTVAGRQWPAARVMPAPWPWRPIGERNGFVARYRAGDVVADWVVPFSQSYINHVLPAPGGAFYVFGTSASPRVPEPPIPGTTPDTRSFFAVLEGDGRLRSLAFTSQQFSGLMTVNDAGEIVVADSHLLRRFDPVTLQQLDARNIADGYFAILLADAHVIALAGWEGDPAPGAVRTLVRWRRSDLHEDARVPVAGLGVLRGLSAAAEDDDHVWLATVSTGATLPLSPACPEAATPSDEVLLLRVAWGSRSVVSARCITRVPQRSAPIISVTRDGRVQVRGVAAAGESRDRYEPVVVRSDDGGRSWHDANDGLSGGGTLVPVTASIAYLHAMQSIHRTTDGGQTWRDVSLSDYWTVNGFSVNPHRPTELWVSAQAPGYETALFRSRDGGESWTEVVRSWPSGVTLPRWFDPASGRVWGNSSQLGGWVVSDDDGVTWRTWGEPGMSILDGSPAGRSYANGGSLERYGLHWSADGGQSWSPALGFGESDGMGIDASDIFPVVVPRSASLLAANPRRPDQAIAATSRAVFATANGGASWQMTGRLNIEALAVAGWTSAGAPVLYQWRTKLQYGGPTLVWRSDDLGASWHARADCEACQAIAPVPGNPDILYATGTRSTQFLPYREFDALGQLVLAADLQYTPGSPDWWGPWSRGVSIADADANGLTDSWEVQFGPALGGPDADPDGDGRLNRTEMLERTHPTATWTAGFAEGFGPMFRTSLDVWNPSASEMARAWLRSERGGVVVDARLVLVPPRSYRRLEHPAGGATTEQSLVIESNVPLVISRTSWWGFAGSELMHAATAESPQPAWYFAEGTTRPGFETFYVLHNPGETPTDVRITWLPSTGTATAARTIALAPHARASVWVNAEAPELAGDDVAALVESLDGVPILAERSVYHSNDRRTLGGGTSTAGAPAPSTSWIFAEGAAGAGFDTYLLLANPADAAADVTVELLYEDGSTASRSIVVPALRRMSIDVGAWRDGHASFSTIVAASRPIVAERTTWWPNGQAAGVAWWEVAADGHVSTGATAAAPQWWFSGAAEDYLPSMRSYTSYPGATYLSIAKLTDAADVALVTLTSDEGDVVERVVDLPAGRRRVTVPVSELATGTPTFAGGRVAIDVQAGDPSTGIVVEQSIYALGPYWATRAGASMTGVPAPRR